LAEFLGAFTVEFQLHFPPSFAIIWGSLRYMIAAEICFLFHQQALFSRRPHFPSLRSL